MKPALLDDIPKRVFDEDAMTVREISEQTGRSQSWVKEFAATQCEAGHWEQVFKAVRRGGNDRAYPTLAYRRKKK